MKFVGLIDMLFNTKVKIMIKSSIVAGAMYFVSFPAGADTCPEFTAKQLHTLQTAYEKGEPYDLGLTMAAITLVESRAGEVVININKGGSPDLGVAQINLKTASNRVGVKDGYKKNLLASKLITDMDFNLQLALTELLYWEEHKDSWAHTVASYNSGWDESYGMKHYVPKVKKSLKTIERCVRL